MKNVFFLILLLSVPFIAKAATITVTSGADAGAGTLRDAIVAAVAGDDIVFSGVTTVTLTSAQLTINKNLTINGGTGVTITRSGATAFRIFNITSALTVVFNKLSITNGKNASQAGGVENNANLTLNDCIIANNESGQGGGLQNNGTMTMNRCFVHSNRSSGLGGGLVVFGSSTTLNNCVFTNNQSTGSALDLVNATGSLTVTNCTIAKNSGRAEGGGIINFTGSVTLKNTIVAENTGANILNAGNLTGAYNLIGTEGGNGGLVNGTNNNKVGVLPLFANSSDPDGADNIFGTADDGLRLTTCNFATNAGNNADAPAGTDIAGNPRVFNTTVDIGAYEFQANSTPLPTITLGTIPAILAGATAFTIPYTATTSAPTTYSISGTGITTVTDAALLNSPILVNLTAAASNNLNFSLTVKNANGCISSNLTGSVTVVQSVTWTGAVSTDWNMANNWLPNFVPTATTTTVVNDVANDPIILSGTMAVAKEIYINKDAALKVNSGGILNVNVTTVSNNIILQGINNSLTNDGTINVGTGGGFGISVFGTATLTNKGTINTNNVNGIVAQPSGNFTFTNESTGIVNGDFRSGSINLTNRGTINYSGSGSALSFDGISTLVNEGTIKITAGSGIYNPTGGIITNNACGKILMSAGNYTFGGATTNAGLMSISGTLNNTSGTFTNTGVLKYGSLTGTVTSNQNSSVIVRNLTYPIFAYGGTFNGAINGIFTDSLATVSAGTFAAPFTFTPLATLPRGIQTLYVKITPSGGACSYIVPFSYNTLTSSVLKVDAEALGLQQNRPNPFSQATTISFTLPETNKAVLTVFDITGRQVFTSNNDFKTGYNEVILNKSVFQTTGTYFYRLTTDKYVAVKKLQFVGE
jgi:Secretion system C-terminal sorting domain